LPNPHIPVGSISPYALPILFLAFSIERVFGAIKRKSDRGVMRDPSEVFLPFSIQASHRLAISPIE
jgi:hypothetical protein